MPTQDVKLYNFWFQQLKRAEDKIPDKYWKEAEARLAAEDKREAETGPDERPVVNEFRVLYENSRSYIDQREATLKCETSPAYALDPVARKRAECQQAYLKFVWHEQKVQSRQSKKLNSALIRNVGFTFPTFDLKKWMPTVKYLPARDVRIDPDCQGDYQEANWSAYCEHIPLDEAAGQYDLTNEERETVSRAGKSALTEDESKKTSLSEDEKKQFDLACVWHIFAKNGAALRIPKEDGQTEIPKTLAQQLDTETPRRYLVFIDGIKRPVKDGDWPFRLDDSENAITVFQLNKQPETNYGFTDYQQMSRMDEMSDLVMGYVESDCYHAGHRKYAGMDGNNMPDESQVYDFLNDPNKSYLPNLKDEAGLLKLEEIRQGNIHPQMAPNYELMSNEARKASGMNELLAESMTDLKDVTAIGVRFQEAQLHQRVNLRLGGPDGYEVSQQEDAVKMLEIAHQFVPKYSKVSVKKMVPVTEGTERYEEEREVVDILPWEAAKQEILNGGMLLELGADAIVGPELAEYWVTTNDMPFEEIRLSTQVQVVPGSTRMLTNQQKAAERVDFYERVLFPIYNAIGAFDLAAKFADRIGSLMGEDRMEECLPTPERVGQFMAQQQQAQADQAEAEEAQLQADLERKQAESEIELTQKQTEAEIDSEREADKLNNDMTREHARVQLQMRQMREQAKRVPAHAGQR